MRELARLTCRHADLARRASALEGVEVEVSGELLAVRVDLGVTRLEPLLDLLEEVGCSRSTAPNKGVNSKEYYIAVDREYSEYELDGFEYYWLRPDVCDGDCFALTDRSASGSIRLLKNELRRSRKLADASYFENWIVVRGDVAEQLQARQLVGAKWIPAELWREREGKESKCEWGKLLPWFELYSDVLLPFMHEECEFYDYKWTRTRERSEMDTRRLVEGDYSVPEPRYHAAELRSIGRFDIAVTRECVMYNGDRTRRMRIVSQRMRQALQELKVPATFVPVHLVH